MVSLWDEKRLRPGWEVWQYPDDGYAPISTIGIAFDGKVVHKFIYDWRCPLHMVGKDLMAALKEHGALKERYT